MSDELDGLLRRVVAQKVELGDAATDMALELSSDGADERLDLVLSLLEEESAVLAQRLAGG